MVDLLIEAIKTFREGTELLGEDNLFDVKALEEPNQQKKSLKNYNLSLEFSKLEKILFTAMLTNNCFFLFLLLVFY
ncbi:unnamed protein product [Meloidogyne enterolobii]|uniref:Uncharacterized protein n=1 Tax=Meloidogyne enterolobii TaxID=390850 RepID=A0ACB0ZU40_MELEN